MSREADDTCKKRVHVVGFAYWILLVLRVKSNISNLRDSDICLEGNVLNLCKMVTYELLSNHFLYVMQ